MEVCHGHLEKVGLCELQLTFTDLTKALWCLLAARRCLMSS